MDINYSITETWHWITCWIREFHSSYHQWLIIRETTNDRRVFLICNSKMSKYCTHKLLIAKNSCFLWHDTASLGNQCWYFIAMYCPHLQGLKCPRILLGHFEKMPWCPEKSRSSYPVMQYHIPEELNPQLQCCENLKPHTFTVTIT